MLTSRRKLLVGGLATLVTAPAIVRATSLMAIRPIIPVPQYRRIQFYDIIHDELAWMERWHFGNVEIGKHTPCQHFVDYDVRKLPRDVINQYLLST